MSVYRIFVEKKPAYAVEAAGVLADLKTVLMLEQVSSVRVINRYDVENLAPGDFARARNTVFSEPQVDWVYDALPDLPGCAVFAVESLPGQFDQRADSCAQCIALLTSKEQPLVRSARIYAVEGALSEQDARSIQEYLINPVDSREASMDIPETLAMEYALPAGVDTLAGFCQLDRQGLSAFICEYALAMDEDDIAFCQAYFRDQEKRDPTITEIRMIDTYWSDHCRHTTFLTTIKNVEIQTPYIQKSYDHYQLLRQRLYDGREKPMTLMDLATIGAKALKADGMLDDLDESDEINACTVKIKVDVDGKEEDWLLLFKNETHNHPTEVEPFGGAATCLGGAIRDPLSGRSYVYQSMRVTGAADPTAPLSETIPGKLPQRKIVTGAADGFSSYGNQIGLATGHVAEIYHPGYAAKRMEIGAVIGAAPAENVVREVPEAGDLVILLGGRTGRDGCGGATGSSKSHTVSSIEQCGAEVQKGNAPVERKLQRLFRNPEVTRLIRRCNDFGAGGVSVAIGELADGLRINLDAVPKKYAGLDGTELAISESQERMAVVVREKDAKQFIACAATENLEASIVAVVTEEARLIMDWNGKEIVNLSREFLSSNGAKKYTDVMVPPAQSFIRKHPPMSMKEKWEQAVRNLNVCSQKGLIERFGSTIGCGTILMPFGGESQLTPAQAMAAKLPVLHGETNTASVMAWGFNPEITSANPYIGAVYAVVSSVAKMVAAGGNYTHSWLTFQEYFERTKGDPKRWGKPFAALLGALDAQLALGIGSIGGKDSMSGSFEELDVPPTLVSFAVGVTDASNIISPEFKSAGNPVYLASPSYDDSGMPDFESVKRVFGLVQKLIREKKAVSVWALDFGGVCEGICKMGFGNRLGFDFSATFDDLALFDPMYGAFLIEAGEPLDMLPQIGTVSAAYAVRYGFDIISMDDLQEEWESPLGKVYPYRMKSSVGEPVPVYSTPANKTYTASIKSAKPRVLIPVFPGTNCEYDTARAFEKAGAKAEIFIVKNLTSSDIEESAQAFAQSVLGSQIIAIPGGFSGGDEPDGSGKFITAFLRNGRIRDAIHTLLNTQDGLICGICNGFQALVKLGLLPYGEIRDMDENCATLTYNTIGRHQSLMVRTRVASTCSPWTAHLQIGDIHVVPVCHGEGRFVAPPALIAQLAENGQIASQYVDMDGNPSMELPHNPNNSMHAIEGLISPDGRIFGKMAHSERYGNGIYRNIPGNTMHDIFSGAVNYYR